jgi:hypothetical protein
MTVNTELERMWKEALVAEYDVASEEVCGGKSKSKAVPVTGRGGP